MIAEHPAHAIVIAVEAIGIDKGEDRPWWRLTKTDKACRCGGELPKVAAYRFTYSSGDEVTYKVGQCPKCGTVFWTE